MTHQNEIDTLLKFNERLLGIIENQFSAATKNKISSDLQTITEAQEGAEMAVSNRLVAKLNTPPMMGGLIEKELDEVGEEEQIFMNVNSNMIMILK